jgi:hypothetical protein
MAFSGKKNPIEKTTTIKAEWGLKNPRADTTSPPGPYPADIDRPRDITDEFIANLHGGKRYQEYFEMLWDKQKKEN